MPAGRPADATAVWVVHHVRREDASEENVKLIGVYSSEKSARAAVERLKTLPGFQDFPDSFHVEKYTLDLDHWTTGFVTV